jgi:hypothetical protein
MKGRQVAPQIVKEINTLRVNDFVKESGSCSSGTAQNLARSD